MTAIYSFLECLHQCFQPFCCSGTFPKCLQWSKCLYCYNGIELWLRILSQTISGNPWQPLAEPRLKNIDLRPTLQTDKYNQW